MDVDIKMIYMRDYQYIYGPRSDKMDLMAKSQN